MQPVAQLVGVVVALGPAPPCDDRSRGRNAG